MIQSEVRMRIGELASRAGVRVDTVRYYEKRGLLPRPPRLPSGYREFDAADLDRLRFIRRAQELGFTLNEIQELLRLNEESHSRCSDVRDIAAGKLEDIQQRIEDLHRIQKGLRRLVGCCDSETPLANCPILECMREGSELADAGAPPAPSRRA